MDALTYLTAKEKGAASITLNNLDGEGKPIPGVATLLVSVPGGFDPQTGKPLPAVERGYQREDLQAMHDAAEKQIEAAQEQLAKAQDAHAAFVEVLSDADAALADVVPLKV